MSTLYKEVYIRAYVRTYDGLSIMVERLLEELVQASLAARDRAMRAGLELLQWVGQVESRAAVPP